MPGILTNPMSMMHDITRTQWAPGVGPSPTIGSWLQFVGQTYPNMSAYCASVMHMDYFSWCGLAVGYCMANSGVAPVFGQEDVTRFLYAVAWLNWGTAVSVPNAGDVLVFDFGFGDRHVTLFESDNGDGTWACRGGNQSHQVKLSNYPKSRLMGIRRVKQALQPGLVMALGDHQGRALKPAFRDAAPTPRWPVFPGTAQLVGVSPSGRATVYVDPTLGQAGLQNAIDLLADADRVCAANDTIFGSVGQPVRIIVYAIEGRTDGVGGADHNACDFVNGGDIEVCASFGASARVSALFEAELSECSMGGDLCGKSTGEALSRWCALAISGNALSDFASAPAWAQAGMPDFVNQTEATDLDAVATGCGMAFFSWLLSKGSALADVAKAMTGLGDSGTLAQAYASLTGGKEADAWRNFLAAVSALPDGVASDDPFGGDPGQNMVALRRRDGGHRLRPPMIGNGR